MCAPPTCISRQDALWAVRVAVGAWGICWLRDLPPWAPGSLYRNMYYKHFQIKRKMPEIKPWLLTRMRPPLASWPRAASLSRPTRLSCALFQGGHHGGPAGNGPTEGFRLHGAEIGFPGEAGWFQPGPAFLGHRSDRPGWFENEHPGNDQEEVGNVGHLFLMGRGAFFSSGKFRPSPLAGLHTLHCEHHLGADLRSKPSSPPRPPTCPPTWGLWASSQPWLPQPSWQSSAGFRGRLGSAAVGLACVRGRC